jgi:hypothetical protein
MCSLFVAEMLAALKEQVLLKLMGLQKAGKPQKSLL